MNVVVIVADQLRADHLGHEGVHPVRTPNIDRLVREGHRFTRAFAANPVCMPNRATIVTGRWPSSHGLRTNGLPLDVDVPTFPRALRAHGWATAAVGKLHLQPMGWPFEEFQLAEIESVMPELWQQAVERFGRDFVSWEDYERHAQEDVILPPDYYGFDDVALTVGHGDRVSGNYVRWARERGWDPMTQAGRENSSDVFPGWGQVYRSSVPADLHPTSYVTEQTVQRIAALAQGDRPFCLHVSYPDPHHPFTPPEEYWRRHDPMDMVIPDTFTDEHLRSPDYIRRIVSQRGFPQEDPTMTWAPTEEQFRHALAAELGAVEFIDDSVGAIVAALEEGGVLDDTLVVFTSDHGDLFGDHGLLLKHFSHYEGAVRVPLIMRGAGVPVGQTEALVSSADIAPTVLAWAGVEALPGVQGTALLSGSVDADRVVAIEEDQPFGLDGLPGPVRIRTLVAPGFRITIIPGHGISELYDLAEDPRETDNLAGRPEGADLLARAQGALLEELVRLFDDSSMPFHAA